MRSSPQETALKTTKVQHLKTRETGAMSITPFTLANTSPVCFFSLHIMFFTTRILRLCTPGSTSLSTCSLQLVLYVCALQAAQAFQHVLYNWYFTFVHSRQHEPFTMFILRLCSPGLHKPYAKFAQKGT